MSFSGHWYTLSAAGQWGGSPVNWLTDTIKVGLLTPSYPVSQDTHQFWSDVQANEISGTGYVSGGTTLTGRAIGAVIPPHTVPLLASATNWPNASFTAHYAVIYKDTGNANQSPLMGWVDFGSDQSVSAGTFIIQWDVTNGVLALNGQ